MFPNFIGLTWENQKTSFPMFLTFRDPESKLPETLSELVFPRNKTSEIWKCNRGATRAKRAWPTWPDAWALWGLPVPPLLL
jgi:hypothetical protein